MKDTKKISYKSKRKELIDLFGGCVICGNDFTPTLQVHHVISKANGGSDDYCNLYPFCPNCHALIHSLMSDSAYKEMNADSIDSWIDKNYTSVQRDKIFYFSLRLLRGGGEEWTN